jgi:hypothetical protein
MDRSFSGMPNTVLLAGRLGGWRAEPCLVLPEPRLLSCLIGATGWISLTRGNLIFYVTNPNKIFDIVGELPLARARGNGLAAGSSAGRQRGDMPEQNIRLWPSLSVKSCLT